MSFSRPVFNRTADFKFPAYRSSKYRFCFPGDSNTIAESTQLGNYILSTPKVRIFCSCLNDIAIQIIHYRMLLHSNNQMKTRRLLHSSYPIEQTRHQDLISKLVYNREASVPSTAYLTDNLGKGTCRHVRARLECRYAEQFAASRNGL